MEYLMELRWNQQLLILIPFVVWVFWVIKSINFYIRETVGGKNIMTTDETNGFISFACCCAFTFLFSFVGLMKFLVWFWRYDGSAL